MSVEQTLAERGKRYGDFADHAKIAQNIKRGMMCPGMDNLPDMHRQALEVIADKIARILSGDPNYADNWHDIQGYAKLVEDRLPRAPAAPKTYRETMDECEQERWALVSPIPAAPAAAEPASEIDDDSPRQQAIAQNGNTGEHYEVDVNDMETWWIAWGGGERPVDQLVDYVLRDGTRYTAHANQLVWAHYPRHDESDIVKYRPAK
jgi:hypothetical protein